MAKKQVKYVQLEPDAFLSDVDYLSMTAEQRGVYCTLIFYLYRNNGKLKCDESLLRKLCNVNSDFNFQTVFYKFKVRRGFIYHKRVTQELQKSQVRLNAAVRAANIRHHGQCDRNATATSAQCQGKGREGKGRKVNKEKEEKEITFSNIASDITEQLSALLKRWSKLFPDQIPNPAQELAASRHLSELLNTASMNITLDDILSAVENLKAVHKSKYCNGKFRYNHNLPKFLLKITAGSTTYLPAYFNIENFMDDENREKYQRRKQIEQRKRNERNTV